MNFSCPRTCPMFEKRTTDGLFDCRFRAIIDRIGPTRTTSHTVKVRVDYRDPRALELACDRLKWKWHGFGKHELFEAGVTGHGFTPEGWYYPAVLDADGEMHSDTFNGSWGDPAKMDLLKGEYAMATAQLAAKELGWQSERTDAGLIIYHPSAGVLTISKHGNCETTGFVGSSCHAARESLGLLAGRSAPSPTRRNSAVRSSLRSRPAALTRHRESCRPAARLGLENRHERQPSR